MLRRSLQLSGLSNTRYILRSCMSATANNEKLSSQNCKQKQTHITSFLVAGSKYKNNNNNNNNTRNMSTAASNKIKEIEGDLFSASEDYALAHCVAADMGMGAGIAVRFKQLYERVDELKKQGVKSGGVAPLKVNNRYIYYLVTKQSSMGRPTYDSLHSSLCAMREHMRQHKVHKLAIPRIGCGIDGLEWDKVSAQLNDVFKDENLEIVVYNYVPK